MSFTEYGNDITNWTAGPPTPGRPNTTRLYPAGDANRDSRVDALDIVQVLQSAKYSTGQAATWSEGDWNDDGVFDRLDLVAALQTGESVKA